MLVLRRSSDPERVRHWDTGDSDDGGDRAGEKDTRPQKRRRIGSLHCAARRTVASRFSSVPSPNRQRRFLSRKAATTQKPVGTRPQTSSRAEKLLLLPGRTEITARRCSTMSLCTPPPSPSPSPPNRRAAVVKLSEVLPQTKTGLPKSATRKLSPKVTTRLPSLRKLLPKIGFDWAVCETRNRHTRKVERRLAGLEGRERRAILRALDRSLCSGRQLDKKGVERGLVEVFEVGLGVLRGDEMKMHRLEDHSLFWEEMMGVYPDGWFERGSVTGEIIHGLVLMTVEARLWDREHGVKIGWMNTARSRSKLVKVVDEFVGWLQDNEDEKVQQEYFGGVEGAVHLDFFGGKKDKEAREILELFRARYVAEDMDIDVDFDELLAEELGDLMARLAIDADEDMVDVDWEEWEWWSGEGGDEGIL